jgi:L-aspartate oxidase
MMLRTADVVIVGSGIAGLTAALALAPRKVIVLTKGEAGDGSTQLAQGGIAAAVGPTDSPGDHAADTIAVGGGLNDHEAVTILTTQGPDRVADLIAVGAEFDTGPDGSMMLGREAGHHQRRILHADGDATGAEVSRALTEAAVAADHIEIVDAFAVDLVVDAGRVAGITIRFGEERGVIGTGAVIFATGGIGRLYANTTNPEPVTGDGLAMAARAGVRLADIEFVQFHPTALASGRDPMSLLTEALRGEGAILMDDRGDRFMVDEHPDAELAPRDVVARANWRRLADGRRVFLDARDAVGDEFPERFPSVYRLCMADGIDPRVDPMPAAPAAHYHMGGIATDLDGRSSLPGLWVVGEAARTGVHGANRLASNSLLEGAVFGRRAAESIAAETPSIPGLATVRRAAIDPGPSPDPQPDVVDALRDLMWDRVGVMRDGAGLVAALEEMDRLDTKLASGISVPRNMLTAARLITTAALIRNEGRGSHWRVDRPDPDPQWAQTLYFNP